MAFVNNYKLPAPPSPNTPTPTSEPYDINFNMPLPPILQTSRVKLVPFIPHIHSIPFFNAFSPDQEVLSRYLPITFPTLASIYTFLDELVTPDPGTILFAIIDLTKPNAEENLAESIAGMIGLTHTSPSNLSSEVAPVLILKNFQRTFISSHACGILLRYCLELPSNGGLGLRRVAWTANPNNAASIRAAQRLGFKIEGQLRWTWVLEEGKEGKPMTGEGRGLGPGRDSTLLALCWDDWEGGARENITKLIDRV